MQVDREQLLVSVTDSSYQVEEKERQISSLQINLLRYLENTENALDNVIANLEDEVAEYKTLIRRIPKSQREILNIQRKLQVNEKMYLFLLEKRANAKTARAGILPQTKVIETARSIGVVGPNKSKTLYLFVGAALVLVSLIAFVRFIFFERIENITELAAVTSIPVLGGVMRMQKNDGDYLVVSNQPKLNVTEAFRGIRTNLQYLNPDRSNKLVMVTSLHPSEGKTFCSTNLSAIIAAGGKRVILIDFDLHKPKIHRALGLNNEIGVSSYLIGQVGVDEAIVKTDIDTLDAMVSGPVPPNASELILSTKVEELLNLLKDRYDYVIVDTPPIGLISDGLALLEHIDVVNFVMNTTFATKQGMEHIEEIIEKSRVKSSGIILNNIRARKWQYYYSKYGYNYGYGYGYGQNYGANEQGEA